MPLHRAAEEMRNLYANEIARAVHTGQQPSPLQVESWAKYDRALRDGDPAQRSPHAASSCLGRRLRSRPARVTAPRQTHTRYRDPSRRVTSTCTARSVKATTTARS